MSDNVLQIITTTMPHMDPVSTGKYDAHVITCNFVIYNILYWFNEPYL